MTLAGEDLAFVARALALKRVARKGWTRVPGLQDPESVAEHSWGVGLLALAAAQRDPTLDPGKLVTIALAHDLAEAVVGDLVPGEYASQEEKHAREAAGLADLLSGADPVLRERLSAAWLDYERRGSREARLIADLDKVEMALQAQAYAREGAKPEALGEFLETARAKTVDPALRALLERLRLE